MERRVVITGLGAITPIGKDVNESVSYTHLTLPTTY